MSAQLERRGWRAVATKVGLVTGVIALVLLVVSALVSVLVYIVVLFIVLSPLLFLFSRRHARISERLL